VDGRLRGHDEKGKRDLKMAKMPKEPSMLKSFSLFSLAGVLIGGAMVFASRNSHSKMPPEAFHGLDPFIMLSAMIAATSLLLGTFCALVFLAVGPKQGIRP
jgi:hypothetical protein